MAVSRETRVSRAVFDARRNEWFATHLAPVAVACQAWSERVTAGNPPGARVYLRDVTQSYFEGETARWAEVAGEAIHMMVTGMIQHASLTSLCANVGKAVARVIGKPLEDSDQGIKLGYLMVSIICDVTGCASIVDKHEKRPEKVTGGVKLTPVYEIKHTSGTFLADAHRYGAVGMPTYSKNGAAPWTGQKSGGVKGQEVSGVVHGADAQMKGVTAETAPALYAAINAAQAVRFRVNPVTAAVVTDYDPAAATAWLLDHFLANGKNSKGEPMTRKEAETAAKEAARP